MSIKPKSSTSPQKEIDLFDEVQFISCQIKAAGGGIQLAADKEYIVLVACNLTSRQKEE